MSSQNPTIRKADLADAPAIHEAHMTSIQTLCSKHHSAVEIAAWGARVFDRDKWNDAIQNHHVWVIEKDNKIEGYAHLKVSEKDGHLRAHLHGLYLTPIVAGQGWGWKMAGLVLEEARHSHAERITLSSTLTAHDFYKKVGFRDVGPQILIEINGAPIRSVPMVMKLS